MDVVIKRAPPLRVGAVLHLGPYATISRSFSKLGVMVVQAGLLDRRHDMVAIYHDDPKVTAAESLRSSAGIVLTERDALPPGLDELEVPGGRCACYVHSGGYEGLGAAWAQLLDEWLPRSGARVDASAPHATYERYLNHPGEVPHELLRTELVVRLADP